MPEEEPGGVVVVVLDVEPGDDVVVDGSVVLDEGSVLEVDVLEVDVLDVLVVVVVGAGLPELNSAVTGFADCAGSYATWLAPRARSRDCNGDTVNGAITCAPPPPAVAAPWSASAPITPIVGRVSRCRGSTDEASFNSTIDCSATSSATTAC